MFDYRPQQPLLFLHTCHLFPVSESSLALLAFAFSHA